MSIKMRASVRNGQLELPFPLALPDGQEVDIVVETETTDDSEGWRELGMERLEAEWDNAEDAIYDDWRKLYGV